MKHKSRIKMSARRDSRSFASRSVSAKLTRTLVWSLSPCHCL